MRSAISLMMLVAALPTCGVSALAQTGAAEKRCDGTRAEFFARFERGPRTPEEQKAADEHAREFVRVCAGAADEGTRQVVRLTNRWIEKYDAALREFESREAGVGVGRAASAALTGALRRER